MGWEWIFQSDPGPTLLMDQEKNEPHHFFEALRLKCGTILPTKLTNMQKQGLHKGASKNKYLLFYILHFFIYFILYFLYFIFFSTCCMTLIIFSTFSSFMIS